MAYRDPVLQALALGEPKEEQAPPKPVREQTDTEKTFFGFMRNLGADVLDVAKGITAPLHSTDEFTKGIENLMYDGQGEFTTDGVKAMGNAVVDRATEIVTEPVDSFYDRPLSTGLDVVGTVVPPLRGASVATGAAGMVKSAGALRQAANAVESLDPFSWPATAGAVANRAGTQMGALDDSVKRTEGVVKPKLSPRHKQSDPAYRQQVITGALERGIDPTEKGMQNLQSQLDSVTAEMNKVMREAGDRQINTGELVGGWKDYANQHFDRTHPEWEKMSNAVEAQEKKLRRQYQNHPDGEIVSINSQGLRQARINADSKVDHNARNLESDSVQAEIDRLYSHYLREQLGNAVPELKQLNAEASALYDIYDMYNPAVMRMSNTQPIGLTGSIGLGGGGLAGVLMGNQTGDPLMQGLGAAVAAAPLVANARPTRLAQARSNYNASQAGFGDALTGALMRDRNTTPGNIRKGVSFTEALISELMPEEER